MCRGAKAMSDKQPISRMFSGFARSIDQSFSVSIQRLGSNEVNKAPDLAAGLTLVELIVTVAILGILASAAVPLARFEVKRQKERILHRELWEIRDAIDKYKDLAAGGAFQTKIDSYGYPPDLQTLVDGVDVNGRKVR